MFEWSYRSLELVCDEKVCTNVISTSSHQWASCSQIRTTGTCSLNLCLQWAKSARLLAILTFSLCMTFSHFIHFLTSVWSGSYSLKVVTLWQKLFVVLIMKGRVPPGNDRYGYREKRYCWNVNSLHVLLEWFSTRENPSGYCSSMTCFCVSN